MLDIRTAMLEDLPQVDEQIVSSNEVDEAAEAFRREMEEAAPIAVAAISSAD